MYFDRNRATLIAGPETLTQLALYLTSGQTPAGGLDPWREANLLDVTDGSDVGGSRAGENNPAIDPTVAGIVEILERPARSVMLEQFDSGQVAVSFVAFDRVGRATIMSGVGEDVLSITATRFDLLPALLTQTLRLNPGPEAPPRTALETSAGLVEQVLTGAGGPLPGPALDAAPDGASPGLAKVLGSFRHAWRASGSWHAKPTDSAITVLFAGAEGFWTVSHGSQTPNSTPTPDTPVQLTPTTAKELTRLLGDVVTGRATRPANRSQGQLGQSDRQRKVQAGSSVGS